ncbi:histidine phosphatase family protein [Candidatus Daviesbacteria bacterium]|nr:histidine phosphatase family protein [Candidatus Daviesbacteria bacterium]
MITIIFETHATSLDNENYLSSGHNDITLSSLGEQQAKQLGRRYKDQKFDTIFCSDLQRSYKTAEIAFGKKFPIIKDPRLRECDYGDLTRHPSSEVEPQLINYITEPFPNGESYEQSSKRIKDFLDDLKINYEDKKVMIIGHRATRFGLEHWIKGVSLETLTTTLFKWQPGWSYQLG